VLSAEFTFTYYNIAKIDHISIKNYMKSFTEMALDPQCQEVLNSIVEKGSPFDTDNPVESRRIAAATIKPLPKQDTRFVDIHEGDFSGQGGSIGYRYYRPVGISENGSPCLIYFHGGGMIFGTLDSHDPICRTVAVRASCVVISIDYRLAPENKFPAAVLDAWSAFKGVFASAISFGIDPHKIAVGGDSAGGNLAAVVSLMARDMAALQPCFQWLIYPNTDMTHPRNAPTGGTIEKFSEDYFLTRKALIWIQNQYLNSDKERLDWRASPIKAESLIGVAPAFVQTAGFDPLKDEGSAYAERLKEAGVMTGLVDYPGMIHGFIRAIGLIDVAQTAIDDGVEALKCAFNS
jgi:acetyl esterase